MNDSKERYGFLSRLFHWGMAALVIWQFLKFFDRINDGEHWVGENLVTWHVSIGALLLVLVLMRIAWALKQKDQRPQQEGPTALLAKIGHLALYALIVLLPLAGISYLVGKGYGLKVFGTQLIAKGDEIAWLASLGQLHSPLAWLLLIMVGGHAGIALLHHFVKKDNTLRRML